MTDTDTGVTGWLASFSHTHTHTHGTTITWLLGGSLMHDATGVLLASHTPTRKILYTNELPPISSQTPKCQPPHPRTFCSSSLLFTAGAASDLSHLHLSPRHSDLFLSDVPLVSHSHMPATSCPLLSPSVLDALNLYRVPI